MCFISGQLSINLAGEYVAGSIEEEARRAFSNVFSVAEAAGYFKEEIVYIDIAFADLAEVETVNVLYQELFAEHKRPARTVYQAAKLPFSAKIKIVATAVKSNHN